MSRLHKQQIKHDRFIRKVIQSSIILGIASLFAIGIFFIYQEFFAKKPLESFIPQSLTSFVSINLKQNPKQEEIIKKLGAHLGDENIIENTLKNIIFPNLNEEEFQLPEDEKMKSWLGEKVGLGYIYLAPNVGVPVFILDLKNQDLAQKFLKRFSDNLEKQGNLVTKETFRDIEITTISGQTELAYAVTSNYLLISTKPDGVKKMIDTKTGRFPSLSESRDFYLTKRRIKSKKGLAFAYLDTIDFLKTIYQATNKQKNEQITKILELLTQKRYLGLSIIPQEDGIKIFGYTRKEGEKEIEMKKTKPFFDKKIPKNIVVSVEGDNLKPFLEDMLVGGGGENTKEKIAKKELLLRMFEIQMGINLENDLFSLFTSHYIFVLLPSSEKIEAGLIAEVKNQGEIFKKLSKLEETTTELLNKYVIKEENKKVNFTDHSFGKTKYRYLNLPDQYQIDICYVLTSNYLILATSESTLEKLLAIAENTNNETLFTNPSYQNSLAQLPKKEAQQIIFIDGENMLKFLNRYIRFDYEKLDKRIKAWENLVIQRGEESKGSFFESYLKIKE